MDDEGSDDEGKGGGGEDVDDLLDDLPPLISPPKPKPKLTGISMIRLCGYGD